MLRCLSRLSAQAAAAGTVVLLCQGSWQHACAEAPGPDWVLITGANKGIGFQLAQQLLEQGRPVIVACRTQRKAEAAAESLRALVGGAAVVRPLQLDFGSAGSINKAVGQLRASYDQRLDCLVNNAGINTVSWSQRAWDAERAVNFEGPVLLAEAVVSMLRPGGRVINVSSSLGQLGPDGTKYGGGMPSTAYRAAIAGAATLQQLRDLRFDGGDGGMRAATRSQYPCPAYRATKAMLNKATQLLAQDARFTSRGISVCCVCPGSVSTDMNPFGKNTAAQGAAGIAWLVNHPQPGHLNGRFWCERKVLAY